MTKSNLPPPICLAMILCDYIHEDRSTGKRTLLGVFNDMVAHVFPAIHKELFVYLCLTEGRGTTTFHVRIIDVDDERAPVFEKIDTITFSDPHTNMDVVIKIETLSFPEPGDYRIQILLGGNFVCERKLSVHLGNQR